MSAVALLLRKISGFPPYTPKFTEFSGENYVSSLTGYPGSAPNINRKQIATEENGRVIIDTMFNSDRDVDTNTTVTSERTFICATI